MESGEKDDVHKERHEMDASVEVRDIGRLRTAVFATRDISAGSCFLTEDPLFIIPQHRELISPEDISKAYEEAPKEQQRRFDNLRTRLDVPDRYDASIAEDVKLMPALMSILRVNLNSGECSTGTAIYDTVCRFNHSCTPNIEKRGLGASKTACWALRDIKKGEEMTGSYCPEFYYMTAAERREALPRIGNPFVCQCRLCTSSPEERLISDLRRHLMRYLHTAIYLSDPACTPIMLDVDIVRQQIFAQTSSWSPRARNLIMSYLLATLADLEGLAVICESAHDYAWAAVHLIDSTKEAGMKCLTPASCRNFDRWISRSTDLTVMSAAIMSEDSKRRLDGLYAYAEDIGEHGEFAPCTGGGSAGHTH
ncbi:hypothetical protein LTR86_006491 [Recurvomyces mirabilis]|nr:hypothetical protein LTR86_006491 [Recurvomyces mirabilis]